ncbi:phage tail assembly chaperone GT [Gracilibacillus halophilus]
MMKSGKDINEILNMPYYFVGELYSKEKKPQETNSLIAAFGG